MISSLVKKQKTDLKCDCLNETYAIGEDCDTTGAMTGAIEEVYYQKSLSNLERYYLDSLDSKFVSIITCFFELISNRKKYKKIII